MNYIDCSNEENASKIEEMKAHLAKALSIAGELGIFNLLYNEAYMAVLVAQKLGHRYNIKTQGFDAYTQKDEGVEYKTISKDMKLNPPSYAERSFQFHWISDKKAAKYKSTKYCYCIWRSGVEIEKIIEIDMSIMIKKIEDASQNKIGEIGAHCSFSPKDIETFVKNGEAKQVYP